MKTNYKVVLYQTLKNILKTVNQILICTGFIFTNICKLYHL